MKREWSTLKKLIWLRFVQGAGAIAKVVTGTVPLTLENAISSAIISLTQYGLCVQDGTPTPDAPVPIKCNNGTLKMVHRSGLPEGYRLLEYVGGSGTQYVITDLYIASTDVIESEFRNSTTTGYGAVYGVFKAAESSALYGNQTYYGYDAANNKVDTDISVDTEWHSARHDFVNGTLTVDDTTVTFTPFDFTNTTRNAVLSRYYNGSYGYNWKGYIRKFKVTRNGEVVCDLLPAKDSNDVAGLYDLATGAFYTATGGTLLEGNEVDDYELAVVGTSEVLTVTATGAETQTASVPNLFAVSNYADEVEIISGEVTRKVGIKVLDGTETGWTQATTSTGVLRFYLPFDGAATPTAARGQVTSSHFVYAGEGQDLGIAFLSSQTRVYFIPPDQTMTGTTWKAWLAAQYAAGTPVIVLYPLATETTESVTPQSLNAAAGTNIVNATAEVSPIELEVEYKATA
jgi:hypothetical protein